MPRVTINNLDKASAQDVFKTICSHLLKQNRKSKDALGCAYRSPDGLKCAAGILVTQKAYRKNMETNAWDRVTILYGFSKNHERLIGDLQIIHDAHEVHTWRSKLIDIGVRYKLDISFLEK